jgi:hypothetical protein
MSAENVDGTVDAETPDRKMDTEPFLDEIYDSENGYNFINEIFQKSQNLVV